MRVRTLPVALAVLLTVPLVGAVPAFAQPDLSKVEVTTEDLGGGVHMLQGAGGNLGVSVGPDGVFLIDDQYAPMTDRIRAAIAELSDRPVRFVLNTHWHGDHTGGNEAMGEAGAVIVAHDNVRERMSANQFISAFEMKVPASPPAALPIITFTEGMTFHLNGDEMHVEHVAPAHTDGDAFVYFKGANVLHTGDLFFNGMYPVIDTSSGGRIQGMIDAANRMLELVDEKTRIIPGHGPPARRADLVAFRDMLRDVRAAVAELQAEGKTLEEVRAADPLAPWNPKWGGGYFDGPAFTGIVFDSVGHGG